MDPSASLNRRIRRKMIMKQKSQSQKTILTDENSSPTNLSPGPTNSRQQNANRVPLSPLSGGNEQAVQGLSFGSERRNSQGSGNFKKRKNLPTLHQSPDSSIINSSNGCSPNFSNFVSSLAPDKQSGKICASNPLSSTPFSEVLNPSSSNCRRKFIRHSKEVLNLVGSKSLNFESNFDDVPPPAVGSGFAEDERTSYYQLEIYAQAETEEYIYFGEPSFYCDQCQAKVWYEERSEKARRTKDVEFSICCLKGKVQLPFLQKPPPLLYNLMSEQDPRSSHFKEHIRAYNSMFSFTSIGGKIESSINDGRGPPQFILSGQNYHRIGSLVPNQGCSPKFAQLYIYDTMNEINNRVKHFGSKNNTDIFDNSLIKELTMMIDENNVLAQSFRRVRDFAMHDNTSNFSLRLYRNRSKDARMYNLPTSNEVAALIVGDLANMDVGRDIMVRKISGELTRLHETHTAFIPLQYPLLFPYGEDGYQEDIPIRDSELQNKNRKRIRISLREFIAFRIQEREVEYGNIVNGRRLFQQFVVDCYTMIESQRLSFIRANQKTIRSDILSGLQEAVHRGETDPSSAGKRVVLPASFTGGTRYMFNNCQDAMAICKRFGYPDLFITITCNSNWKEIHQFISERGLTASDRPDIVSRVFKMKLDTLMADFKKNQIFGKVNAGMYTVEFQKRGLPHAHILLWLDDVNKLRNGNDIDKFISAELPHPDLYPKLADAVSNYMIHGPCGVANFKSPCMKEGKCSKYYLKKFQTSTTIDDDGYPSYKRQDSGLFVHKNGVKIDNRSVVPYNPLLLMRYQAHVNTEYCNKSNSIKYLFKYVNKGPDRATIEISNESQDSVKPKIVDEIKQYYDCRYVSPCEAVWRIFGFDIHHRWPPVQRLSFHLPNEQSILFKDDDRIDAVVSNNDQIDTMFLAWFEANKTYEEGRNLSYAEFPSKFVYERQERKWKPRKQGFIIGRLTYIPAGTGELYYMRILLTIQKGCTDYESIRTVNNKVYPTFHEACYALGLLADDKEYIDAINEASELASGNHLRKLFVTLLVMNCMSKPDVVWNSTWKVLSDGIVYQRRKTLNVPDLLIGEDEIKNLCLIELEKLLQSNGKSLKDYRSLPLPDMSDVHDFLNKYIVDELNYDRGELAKTHASLLESLTEEQRIVYNEIMNSVYSRCGGVFFLYGYGGTGKTFLWKTLSAGLRSEGMIVLNVASSGIASLLLPGGRTAHSTFCIPLIINEQSTCNISQGSPKAKLLLHTKLIIWDEAPMMNRFCFEAFDRTLRDVMRTESEDNIDKPFGGKVIVFGGDFRQILPVVRKGTRKDIVGASINSSEIWKSCKVLRLTRNMRLHIEKSNQSPDDIKKFADWILTIGDGDMDASETGESDIFIPEDLLIPDCEHPLQMLVDFVYPDLLNNISSSAFFEERAILAPTLESVERVNDFLLSLIPGDEKEYLSSDTPCLSDQDYEIQGEWFTSEFLNDITCSGIPNHRLKLKVGVPVMLLRNIDQSRGLCNGTRLQINDLGKNIITATVITGKNIGEKILLPRMDLVPSDPGFPFKFQRRQFPLSLCFAMTINKSQGQSLSKVGLYLPKPVFTHGQLYVAVSRVKSKMGLKILILDEEGKVCTSTKNVVYREVFQSV